MGRQTGLVLWIVPSDSIYTQTRESFSDRQHPYRTYLERASAGRLRLLEADDVFSPADLSDQLCVMLITLQTGNVYENHDDIRRFHRSNGAFMQHFPPDDDIVANGALLQRVPNLRRADLADGRMAIRSSLANVIRMADPIIILDEGHNAYSPPARAYLNGLNPRFILELSATPNGHGHLSNLVVDIGGGDLHAEEMIKLPIEVDDRPADWREVIRAAKAKRDHLEAAAEHLHADTGRYIRPIALNSR